jgi:hypothetical protein
MNGEKRKIKERGQVSTLPPVCAATSGSTVRFLMCSTVATRHLYRARASQPPPAISAKFNLRRSGWNGHPEIAEMFVFEIATVL